MFDRLIRFTARFTPDDIAVIGAGGHVTYREFDRAIDRVAAELAKTFEPASDEVVGLAVADQYLHHLLIVALARLGIATSSLLPGMIAQSAALSGVRRIIGDDPAQHPAVLVDPAWTARVLAADAVPPAVTVAPDAIGRVQLSSGTTGIPKACALSWALIDLRTAHAHAFAGNRGRTLSLVGPESGVLQIKPWSQGGCVLFGDRDTAVIVRQIREWQPTMLIASPSQIAGLLDAWPSSITLNGMIIALVGARADRALRDRVLKSGARLGIGYGSTEAGLTATGVAFADGSSDRAGVVTPWTEVAIRDEAGQPVADGEPGRIFVRGSDMVSGYIGEAPFADGWFDTGDLGYLRDGYDLFVIGRVDDVMNFGGRKLAPEALEEQVRGVPGIRDVAAFALPDAQGIDQPWLAIVRGEGLDEAAIGPAITIPELPPVRIAWIEAIPRTRTGKVQRDQLRTAAAALN